MTSASAWLPWLTVAAIGALHGLSPANGWLFAAAHGHRSDDPRVVRRTLLPIATGHAASVLLVVILVLFGTTLDAPRIRTLAGVVLLVMAACRLRPRRDNIGEGAPPRMPGARLALWSCLMGTAQGSGLMLVPALLPLCMSDGPARAIAATGSFTLMLAAIALHLLTMLATTHAVATTVCHGLRTPALVRQRHRLGALGTCALALTGILLVALR